MRGRILLALLLALCVPMESQARALPDDIRAQVETSMLVGGTVDIDRDGRATGAVLDQAEKLPAGVVRLVDTAVANWRFEPVLVDGAPANVRTRMSLRVVATPQGDDAFAISLRSASFGLDAPDAAGRVAGASDDAQVRRRTMAPPKYPQASYQQGIQGTVYLVARIDRSGDVEDVVTEQVNLTVYGTPRQMESGRKDLADASMRAARRWSFHVPTEGDAATQPYWLVRIPVSYAISDTRLTKAKETYGTWETYLPGPRTPAPWGEEGSRSAGSPDALPDGALSLVGSGPTLLTPLEG